MLILNPVFSQCCLIKQEFHEEYMIEGDIHRSRKLLSPVPVSLFFGYKCKNRVELRQGIFQVLYSKALNIA